jgi:hypothetical protein
MGGVDATALAGRLDLDLDAIGICFACLSIVSMALDSGDQSSVRREVEEMAPDLWEEGLALPVLGALERARRAGDDDAAPAIAEIERVGPRSAVVRAVVLRLAQELSDRMRADFERAFPKGRVVPLRPR